MDRFEVVSMQSLKSGRKLQRTDPRTREVTYSDEIIGSAIILRDKQTGVHYLWTREGNGSIQTSFGLTVMLDPNGKPVTSNYSVTI